MDPIETSKINKVLSLAKKNMQENTGEKKDTARHIVETCAQIKSSNSLKIKKYLISKLEKEAKKL